MKIFAIALIAAVSLSIVAVNYLFRLPETVHVPDPTYTPITARQIYAEPVQRAFPTSESPAGAVYWSDVPRDWKVCVQEAKVYNNPGENPDWYIYSLSREETVMVRELDSSRTFAMIQPAEYTLFTNLCR